MLSLRLVLIFVTSSPYLAQVGFRLSGEILSIIVLRFMRKDGTLRFGDFVAIILNLTVAFGRMFVCPRLFEFVFVFANICAFFIVPNVFFFS